MRTLSFLIAAGVMAALAQATSALAALSGPSTNLPVYPDSTKLASQMPKPMKTCGRDMMVTVYQTKASSDAVERWYISKIAGATSVKIFSPSAGMTGALILLPGGAEGVSVSQVHVGAGNDTVIGLTAYDPPYGDRDVATLRAATKGDRTAQATFKRLCDSD